MIVHDILRIGVGELFQDIENMKAKKRQEENLPYDAMINNCDDGLRLAMSTSTIKVLISLYLMEDADESLLLKGIPVVIDEALNIGQYYFLEVKV